MTRFDVTTVGEANLRLSVPSGDRLAHATQLDLNIAGTEANVTCALAQLGHRCGWISTLPKSPLGERAMNGYRFSQLDMSAVKWVDEGRMATLFVEYGAQPRPTQVYYDRKKSAFSKMTYQDIDWGYLLDTHLIHLTGITAALSDSSEEMTLKIVEEAQKAGVPLSFDVNYRSKLWCVEKARRVLSQLLPKINILFCNKRDAIRLFDLSGSREEIVTQLAHRFRNQYVVMSDGTNGLVAWVNGSIVHEPVVPVDIVDRIGAGDAMAAGVLHGWLNGDFVKGLRYGALTASCAMSQKGDLLLTSLEELEWLDNTRGESLTR